jgi:hypothetical protein
MNTHVILKLMQPPAEMRAWAATLPKDITLKEMWNQCPEGGWLTWFCDGLHLVDLAVAGQEAFGEFLARDPGVRKAHKAQKAALKKCFSAQHANEMTLAAFLPVQKAYMEARQAVALRHRAVLVDLVRKAMPWEQVEVGITAWVDAKLDQFGAEKIKSMHRQVPPG